MTDHERHDDDHRLARLDLALWRRVLAHARPYRRQLVGLAIAGMLLAIAESLMPLVTGWIIDGATERPAESGLLRNSLVYVGLVAVTALLIWFFIVMAGRAATGVAHDMRRAAFARLQELDFSFYDRRPVGWLMARLTSDCSRLSAVIPWSTLDFVWGTSMVAGISVMMLILNWRLALLVLAIVPPLAAVSVVFQRMLLGSQRRVRRSNSLLTAAFNEGIMGVRTSKALVREQESLAEFQLLSAAMFRHSVQGALQAAVYLPVVLTLGSIGVGLALWRGGLEVDGLARGVAGAVTAVTGSTGTVPAAASGMSIGVLVAFMQYAALFWIPIQEMAERFTELQAAQASAERLQGLLDTEPEIRDAAGAVAGEERIRLIEFRKVSFAYNPEEPVLADFDLRAHAGETIALVGATGGGKSTIVSLLCRFYEPTGGVIAVNGVDYRRRSLHWLQSNLGIVLQTPHLFSGSIGDNIRYGRLEADDQEVIEAARLVGAHDFIVALDGGYDTEVGEGGARLSTGQRQLVSLARAVLADPQIFVMDEATSSVDTETERLIQRGIETVLEGRISFIIAHRLSTIRSADRILVIDRGRIVEEGGHEELLRRRGRYRQLYTDQFARESADTLA